jgi:uncharacterized DUF497 family protein
MIRNVDRHVVSLSHLRESAGRKSSPVRIDAARIFDGPTVERVDDRFEYDEVRIYAIGLVNGIEITVVYTDRASDERQFISAWRAEPHERRYFWQHLED